MVTPSLAAVRDRLTDRRWRLSSGALYKVTNESGVRVPFIPRPSQRDMLAHMHSRNIVLKARQLGFTTLWALAGLDQCVWNSNRIALFIAQDVEKAQDTFTRKIRAAYDDLPEWARAIGRARADSTRQLAFANGSSITVDTSGRGGTFQFVHVSELGKIAAKWPAKAREINTGTFNAVPPDGVIVVESTAEGQQGLFYDMCQKAQERSLQPEPLSPLEFKFFFFPWWGAEERNRTDPTHVIVSTDQHRYFDALEDSLNDLIEQGRAPEWLRLAAAHTPDAPGWVRIDDAARAWYAITARQQGDDMKREHPSTPEEAFEASIEGAFYKQELARANAQGRYGDYPFDPRLGAVYTFHDIGRGVHAIWFAQRARGFWRFFLYREIHHGGATQVANLLQEEKGRLGLVYGRHFLPHDGVISDWSADLDRAGELASRLGVMPDMIEVVERTKNVFADHQKVRDFIDLSLIDRQGCAQGWSHMNSYKRAYSDTLGTFIEKEDESGTCVHGADAFRTAAMADWHGMILEESYIDTLQEARQSSDDSRRAGADPITGY